MNGYQGTGARLKALAHPVRLQLVAALAQEGEACVCHLEARLDQRQAYISQHLATLREAGLVVDRREGLNVFYSLALEEIKPLVEAAKKLEMAMGRAQGVALTFDGLQQVDPGDCPCPRCQEQWDMDEAP